MDGGCSPTLSPPRIGGLVPGRFPGRGAPGSEGLNNAMTTIQANLARQVGRGKIADEDMQAALSRMGAAPSAFDYAQSVEDTLDALAEHLEDHIDIEGLLALAEPV